MRLTRQSIQRIGSAVRTVEAGRGAGKSAPASSVLVLRMAQVASGATATASAGAPYVHKGSIYAGRWDESSGTQAALVTGVDLWASTSIATGEWAQVQRVGGHWEVISQGGMPVNPSTYDTIGGTTEGDEAASTTTWTSGGANGLWFYVQTRQGYFHGGDQKWYAYARKVIVDASGRWYSVGAEARIEIDSPVVA